MAEIRDPFGSRTAPRRQDQEGETRNGGRLTYRNGQWVETNVVHEGQTATLNGQRVVADGKGNWERVVHNTNDGSWTRTKVGNYNQGLSYGSASTKTQPVASLSEEQPGKSADYTVNGVTYDGKTHRPKGAPDGGYSLKSDGSRVAHTPVPETVDTPDTPPTPAPTPAPTAAPTPEPTIRPSDTRTSPTGLIQRGMTLGGVRNYLQGTGLELADADQYFQMGEPTYGSKVTGPNNEVLKPETDVWSKEAGGLVPPSTAGVTGKSPQNPQAGVSDVPDQADNSRALSLSGGEEPFGGTYGDDDEYVSPMYADKARNKWRSTFLDSRAKGPAALMREADASIGVIRDNQGNISYKNGDSYSTYSGDGDTRDVIYDIRGGQSGFSKHQSDFTELGALEVPDTPTIKPDDEQTEATLEGAATIPWKDMNKGQKEDTVSAFAQDFANWYKQGVKDQNK